MVRIQENEIQKYLLAAAKAMGQYCEEKHLRYYLSGGTLLGAVRHKGFIPWDDDIDIMMPRADYEKLINGFSHDRYNIASCEINDQYGVSYARLWDNRTIRDWGDMKQIEMGIYIDILPIDGYPDSVLRSYLRDRYLLILRKFRLFMLHKHSREHSKFKLIKELVRKCCPFSANYFSRKINTIGRQYSFDDSIYVGVQSGTYHQERERNPKSIFEKTIYLQFEDTQFPAPSGYDKYLRHLFGDYMQLPPVEQRVGRHAQDVYLTQEE